MAVSSGTRSLLAEVATWAVLGSLAVALLWNYDRLRHMASAHFDSGGTPLVITQAPPAASSPPARSGTSVELRAGESGHYHTRADVNGREIQTMVDTGASIVVLTYEDARSAGLSLKPSDFVQTASTANGTAKFAPVTLDRVRIGDITVRNVRAAVADRGRLAVTLLGMSFLNRLDRVDMRDGVMVLKD